MVQLTHNGLIFNDFGLYVPIIPIVCTMSPAKGHGIQEVSGSIPLISTKTNLLVGLLLLVGTAVLGVPQCARRQLPTPGETARSPHLSFREAKPRTPGWPLLALRANSPSGNLLEHRTNTHGVAGDCTTGIPFGHHVGLWPPRNDMENRTWSIF